MKNWITLLLTLLLSIPAWTQTNVRAWYRNGQVWVVWEAAFPLPDWYEIYAKPTPFSSTTDAVRIGKLHKFEYGCVALKEQVDTTATPRIPAAGGPIKYQLEFNEALFVFTPHQEGALYFAVVADGETGVVAGDNITDAIVPFQYDPVGDPVQCHLQRVFPSPFSPFDFTCAAFLMWADGRQNQWENRPDFPVMANAAKNGMPSLFMVSIPNDLDTTQPFPMSVWLHGGGGTARQSLAGSRAEIDIRPNDGILLAHDDNLAGWRDSVQPNLETPTWHFGWLKNYNPFNSGNLPLSNDTIVNYTQRRYLWIDNWMLQHYNIDPARIHIYGHSMGSAGSTALAKCYPEHYASCTIFNNGFGGPESTTNVVIFGEPDDNYPTNLVNAAGETVRLRNLWNLLDNCSPTTRDLPLFRHWHGKNDDNGTMRWDAYVVENYRKADSLGIGIQNMWSERSHGVDTGPDYNDHWVSGIAPNLQTLIDNVAFVENYTRSDESFPAFFNHHLDAKNNDPGTGLLGINNGDGDNWGAWGGYHRWNRATLVETPETWAVTAWLEDNAVFPNDNCPHNFLSADLAIRRPQAFKPSTGTTVYWRVRDVLTSNVLQSGIAIVQNGDLVTIPRIEVYRENIRRVRIEVSLMPVATEEVTTDFHAAIAPNPSANGATLHCTASAATPAQIRVSSTDGRTLLSLEKSLQQGANTLYLPELERLPAGCYFVDISNINRRQTLRWLKR